MCGAAEKSQGSPAARFFFKNRQKLARKALHLATDQGNTALADAIRAQIRLYQSGFPYRYNNAPSIPAAATQH